MSPRKHDPATVAFEALALDALRRTSRGERGTEAPRASDHDIHDDAVTELHLRASAPTAHEPRRHSGLFPTVTVRAVAASSEAMSSPRGARSRQLTPRMPPADARRTQHARSRWRTMLGCGALAISAAALLTAALIAWQPSLTPRATAVPQLNRAPLPAPVPASQLRPRPAHSVPPPPAAPAAPPPAAPSRSAARATAPSADRVTPRSQPVRTATPASAAEALASGDYSRALASYRELAARNPQQPVFATITRILTRDLARICDPTTTPPGTPCPH